MTQIYTNLIDDIFCLDGGKAGQSIRLHLDNYIQETLSKSKAAIRKFVKPKQVPMQLGVVLKHDLPRDPKSSRAEVDCSLLAKLQFAASWVRCDIAFTASLLARFCASAGA